MSLVNTLMQSLRSQYTPQYDKNELRESRYGALRAFQQDAVQAPIFDAETIANIKRSYGNTVVVPVLDAQTVTVGPGYVRTCAIVDDENVSQLVQLSFTSYGWAFSMTPATHYNNDVKYQADFDRKLRKYILEFASVLDSACVAQLEADKNIFWTNIAPAFYPQIGDALQVTANQSNDFYNQSESIMNTADFYDMLRVIVSTSGMPLVRRLDNPQSYKGFQVLDPAGTAGGNALAATGSDERWSLMGHEWFPTNRIANGAGINHTGYLVERGSLFIDNRNDADTVIGHNIMGGSKIWEQVQVPVVEFLMGAYFQEDCADRSAIAGAATAGNTRSKVEGYEWSTDIILATAYNSNPATQYNPIMKFEVSAT